MDTYLQQQMTQFKKQFPSLNHDNLQVENGNVRVKDGCVRYRYTSYFHFNPLFLFADKIYLYDGIKWTVKYVGNEEYVRHFPS